MESSDAMQRSTEKVFAEFGAIKVTSARLIVPRQTYVLSGITSVKFGEVLPDTKGRNFVIFLSLAFFIIGVSSSNWAAAGFGMFLMVAAYAVQKRSISTYYVVLHTAGAEERAYKSENRIEVESVISALNEAIVYRSA